MKAQNVAVLMMAMVFPTWGCAGGNSPDNENESTTGTVALAVMQVPSDTLCIEITVVGSRTVSDYETVTPGSSATIPLDGLPIGLDTFTGAAYGVPCSQVTSSTVPIWITDPITATVKAGTAVSVPLEFHRNGLATVVPDFNDDVGLAISVAKQSATTVGPKGSSTFFVSAVDAQGNAISFSWSASTGTLGAPTTTATTSEVVWTTSGRVASDTITVTATDTAGQTAAKTFVASTACSDPSVGIGSPTMQLVPQGYCIDTTEVTRAQYAAWLGTSPAVSGQLDACTWNTSYAPDTACMSGATCETDCDNHPQECVNWCDAAAFCAAAGKRLCGKIGGGSNAFNDSSSTSPVGQWQNACTSGGKYAYTYGNEWDGTQGFAMCADFTMKPGGTIPVGSVSTCTSPDLAYNGVFDLTGNVWEWEDSCDGATGQSDNCHIRGGTIANCASWRCDYPYNIELCGYTNDSFTRNEVDALTGFRCCSL